MENITPKHFFLHIFTIITLYFSAANLITLLFQYINVLVPDALAKITYYDAYRETIRFALASIIVIFPVFLLGSWFLQKNYLINPDVRKMWIRKWLVYFTLFVGTIIIVSNLVAIVLWFLKGEITLRFILKTISLLVVISAIFVYYNRDIRRETVSPDTKYWAGITVFVVFVVILVGFFLAGSPQKERLRQFDRKRTEDLNNIQWQIISYWQKKERLPEKLSDLNDLISGYKVPNDSQTNQSYEYIVKSADSFDLCANFNLTSEKEDEIIIDFYNQRNNWTWQHGVGKECFNRIIDKELYPFDPERKKTEVLPTD